MRLLSWVEILTTWQLLFCNDRKRKSKPKNCKGCSSRQGGNVNPVINPTVRIWRKTWMTCGRTPSHTRGAAVVNSKNAPSLRDWTFPSSSSSYFLLLPPALPPTLFYLIFSPLLSPPALHIPLLFTSSHFPLSSSYSFLLSFVLFLLILFLSSSPRLWQQPSPSTDNFKLAWRESIVVPRVKRRRR